MPSDSNHTKPVEDEVEEYPSDDVRAADVAGVPHVHVSPLTVMRIAESTGCHFVPETGVYAGVLCYSDATLTFNPVVVPRMTLSRVVMAIEFTSFDSIDSPPTCSMKVVYLSRDGKTRGLVTHPVPADGEVLRVEIPARHVRAETVLATALKVVLMDSLPADHNVVVPSGVQGSDKRPILVRGAWLEFPFDR
jgi:hypothetical protein